ncbi:D-alanyl-D-alanine carboxypeptidase/D-alanyl-D-alanine-endopeptidase [Luteimicrobium xylanilyticum]|uniref:Penicillin-sensitive carboxypeptidase n=1 Tax=Luteimicrobium xylanilyticum TaxID=1133546 RepID=A0A5P9Q6Q9_9MICO|nr:D-alanyl-D-alanine carboxypeptidase/D-alanyl-D-alanine-endopeptidase [Luteimicrobium xylanilyticum]QFU97094.1 Penicillin-sensitive carboxypeptidase [Luteimicrobium xylanilyticum]
MGRTLRVTSIVVAAAVVLAGGYAVADAHDVVPGVLTTAPEPTPPPPFPTAPAAAALAKPSPAPGLSEDAPAPSSASVAAAASKLVHGDAMGSHVGVQVVDRLTGDVLAASGANDTYVPASTQKLLTGVAALTELDPSSTLTTKVVQGSGSTIALVGGGDQLLAAGKGSASKVDGRAGLADLATQVADALELQGRTSVRLLLDDGLFTGPSASPTWDPGFVSEGFVAHISALAVDEGRMTDDEYAQRYADPAMNAADVFAAALAKRGIKVQGVARGSAPAGGTELGHVESAPVRDVVAYALELSDNTITEGLGRLVADAAGLPASFDGATKAVLASVARLGVDLDGARLADCSGLGKGSRLSPRQLSDVLALITSDDHPELTGIVSMLPISGLRGTLDDRFLDGDARGMVRAKTGSLNGVTSLAGTLVTKDGRELLFVVMADKTGAVGQWGPRAALDAFVSKLASCGCS